MRTIDYASKQLNKIQNRIKSAASAAGRDASEIALVGASKKQSADLIRSFHEAGLRCVGENYLQESLDKQQALADVALEWHFIGKVQSNKTRLLAGHFDWIQGVDRIKIARRLSTQRTMPKPLQLLIQLNIDDEQSKGGVSMADAAELSVQISELPNLDLRGFMLIPEPRSDEAEMTGTFAMARELLESTNQRYGLRLDTLSMGMSGDLELAIREGSTMVRVGTDLFGPRSP